MRGIKERISDHELDLVLRAAFGERDHRVTAMVINDGQVNDVRLLAWPDGTRRFLRVAPSDATAAAGLSWLTAWGLRREAAVIAAAADLARFLPVTAAHDFDRAVIDRDWVIQEAIPGQPLSTLDSVVDASVLQPLWRQFGAFTRRLHEVVGPHYGPPAWGPRCGRWSELLALDVEGFVADASRFGLATKPFLRLGGAIARLAPRLDEKTLPRLVHSDLWPSHVLVTTGADGFRLAGVIDFEFGHYADALSEHLVASFRWGDVPVAMESAFREGYGLYEAPPDAAIRNLVYLARGLGWEITLRAFQGQATADLMQALSAALDKLDRG